MQNKKLKLKGLHTPRCLIFLHGLIDGRAKTAELDPESKILTSAYVSGRIFLFDELCCKCAAKLENELNVVRTEAETLIQTLADLPEPPTDKAAAVPMVSETSVQAQACRAAAASAANLEQTKKSLMAQRQECVNRLIELRSRLALAENICNARLTATADALRSRLCTYARGVLLKPVYEDYIPAVGNDKLLDDSYARLDALQKKITDTLEGR